MFKSGIELIWDRVPDALRHRCIQQGLLHVLVN